MRAHRRDAARRSTQNTLLDRTIFVVSPKVCAEFLARRDAPPQPNERLRRALQARVPWTNENPEQERRLETEPRT
ncbi:MAG TPA: DUF1778 domain-containing protein [Bryobacteraceae bacterium]